MSDACRATPSRRIDSRRSTSSFLSAPPLPGGVRRPRPLCTGSVPRRRRRRRRRVGAQPELLPYLSFDRRRDLGVLAQKVARVLAALADPLAVERVPGARLLDDALLRRDVDELAFLRDAGPVEDVELGLAERRGDLVLHDLHLGPAPDHLVA